MCVFVHACVCVCEREREIEYVCVRVRACACVCVRACLRVFVRQIVLLISFCMISLEILSKEGSL